MLPSSRFSFLNKPIPVLTFKLITATIFVIYEIFDFVNKKVNWLIKRWSETCFKSMLNPNPDLTPVPCGLLTYVLVVYPKKNIQSAKLMYFVHFASRPLQSRNFLFIYLLPGLRIRSIFGRIRIQQIRIFKTGSGSF